MDTYAIICIFTLVIQSFWHAIIGSIIFINTPDNRISPSTWYVNLDHWVLIGSLCLFIVLHIGLISWLFLVPLKHRKDMRQKDIQYEMALSGKKPVENPKKHGKKSKKSNPFSRIPIDPEN